MKHLHKTAFEGLSLLTPKAMCSTNWNHSYCIDAQKANGKMIVKLQYIEANIVRLQTLQQPL